MSEIKSPDKHNCLTKYSVTLYTFKSAQQIKWNHMLYTQCWSSIKVYTIVLITYYVL